MKFHVARNRAEKILSRCWYSLFVGACISSDYLSERTFPESLEEPVSVIALPVEDEESFIIAPDELLPGEFILLKDDLSLSIRNNVIHFLSIFP
jgi:hypothetical protein